MRPAVAWRAALAVLLLLGGCVTTPPHEPTIDPVDTGAGWADRVAQLQGIDQFDLRGRLSVTDGQSVVDAGVHWVRSHAAGRIDLVGPLGMGGAHVQMNGADVALIDTQGKQLHDDAAHAALESALGIDPPLGSLRYWVLGVSDPASHADELIDDQRRLARLDQGGWHVEYPQYSQVGALWLPHQLIVTRDSMRLRIVINDWHIGPR